MVALRDGKYTTVPLKSIMDGVKRVDIQELYDSENYRPRVLNVIGKPMFLYWKGVHPKKHEDTEKNQEDRHLGGDGLLK